MGRMTIVAYTDENFNSEYKSALELPINPDKVKFTKGVRYAEDKQLGEPERVERVCALSSGNPLL
ncbi:hypothetical protein NXV86_11330 [Bacteroides sp. BFG-257]|uniref:CIS tube protein n=1 Tax=Bacteroides sp. BFG-257 TaxID=2972761 RepID=UPI002161AD28|nr:hypothetical protein [Bacteroides sp. BFG-257]UVP00469.1 hypothetical protein NXV86_11330 [Bacteroides sp. BFG-257]